MEVFKQQGKLLEMPEAKKIIKNFNKLAKVLLCLLYTSDAADDMQCVDLGGRRIIKKGEA